MVGRGGFQAAFSHVARAPRRAGRRAAENRRDRPGGAAKYR
jgi:hypothetical protein